MTTLGFILLACCVFAINAMPIGSGAESRFDQWMTEHGKVYATAEEFGMRFRNFQESLYRIERKNSLSKTAKYALNKFSDLSTAEFKATYLMKNSVHNPNGGRNVLKPKAIDSLPDTFDWRDNKVVSPVKDQGQCGSCWAFSVVENVESVWMLAHNMTADKMPALAPQELVDCDDYDLGCNGGNPSSAYSYLESNGLEKESDYPYTATDGTCAYNKEDVYAKVKTWEYATTLEDEKTLQQNLVTVSPLSICVDASNWQDYSSGVMGEWECCWACMLDHCVQLIGYNSKASTPYWIVRNSWGTDWGIHGYIWVEMGHNTCGLTEEATTAVV